MIIRKKDVRTRVIKKCHGGKGKVYSSEFFVNSQNDKPGFRFIHDDTIEPGATVGEHTHTNNEEIYLIVEGHGTMAVDGVEQPVGPGDVCMTCLGHSHSLVNSGDSPMRLWVVGINV